MDALDRILPLASLLWPVLDCDVSISRDPATGDATFRARVFDVDHPSDLAAKPLAEGTGGTPSDAAEALAALLAERARPQLDALLRAAGAPAPDAERLTRALDLAADERNAASVRAASLAADVARLERGLADVTRERDGLRVQLQAAHRAAGEGVDLRRYVLRADVVALCDREERRCMDEWRPGAARDVARISALVSDLGGEHIESSEQQGVEGGEGHGGSR